MKEKKINHSGLILLLFFAITVGIPIWMFCYVFSPKAGEPRAIEMNEYYHQKMEVLLESEDFKVSGNKAVCYFSYSDKRPTFGRPVEKGPFFTKDYIPMRLLAMKPEDARYIVRCNSSCIDSSVHYGRKHISTDYEYKIDFEIFDRSTGEIVDTWSMYAYSDLIKINEIQQRIERSISKRN